MWDNQDEYTQSKRDERLKDLDKEWQGNQPCSGCNVRDVCKYCGTIKRPDYNGDIFDIKVECKLKDIYCGYKHN